MWELWNINLRLRVIKSELRDINFFSHNCEFTLCSSEKTSQNCRTSIVFFLFLFLTILTFFLELYIQEFLLLFSELWVIKSNSEEKKLSILIFSCSISLLDSQFWLCISQLLIYSTQFREKKVRIARCNLAIAIAKKKIYIYFLFLFSSRNKLPYVSLYRSKEKQLN